MTKALVVGSGPNGLAAAVTLAQAGVSVHVVEAAGSIGGGTRSSELTLPGLVHDDCSAFHPLAVASPFFAGLPLAEHGLTWRVPPVQLAHPLGAGRPAAALYDSVEETARGLGRDGAWLRRLVAPAADSFADVAVELLQPPAHLPRHPLALARIGLPGLAPATVLARTLRTEAGRALLAGNAAHAVQPLEAPGTAAVGLTLMAAGLAHGWPVAVGGSQAITTALASVLGTHGGTVETGVNVSSAAELSGYDLVMLDVSPRAALGILGTLLPARVARAYRRFRYGPGAFKLDLAVESGVPWSDDVCRRAGTVHVGGDLAEIADAERQVAAGRMPPRPFVLVGQQYLADPGRSVGDVHPVWAYAHVPAGYAGDASEAILRQVERYAPGLQERILARHVRGPADLERHDANYIGGDIACGASTLGQLLARPRLGARAFDTGVPGVYLCSSATSPGAGVHGMCGHLAARRALRGIG